MNKFIFETKEKDKEDKKTKDDLLRQLYPNGSDEFYINLSKNMKPKQLTSEKNNMLAFNRLGFQLFQCQDSEIQESIRLNSKPFSVKYNSVLDLFKELADKIQTRNILILIDKCILKHFYNKPSDIEQINNEDPILILNLNQKFSGYVPNCLIQKNLILPEFSKQKSYKVIKNRILHALSLDFEKLPPRFFSIYVLDFIFSGDQGNSMVDRFCLNGVILLYNLSKIIGENNLGIIKDTDIQFKSLLNSKDDHELSMKRLNTKLISLMEKIIEIDVYNSIDECILDANILKNILNNSDINSDKGLKLIQDLKIRFPHLKLDKQAIWFGINPLWYNQKSTISVDTVHENLKLLINSVQHRTSTYNLKFINDIFLTRHPMSDIGLDVLLELNKNKNILNKCVRFRSEQNITSKFVQNISKIKLPLTFSLANMPLVKASIGMLNRISSEEIDKTSSSSNNDIFKDMISDFDLIEKEVSERHHIIEVKNEILRGKQPTLREEQPYGIYEKSNNKGFSFNFLVNDSNNDIKETLQNEVPKINYLYKNFNNILMILVVTCFTILFCMVLVSFKFCYRKK